MLVIHAHWQPPQRAIESGGLLFWAETSDARQPTYWRGRLPKKFQPKEHPLLLPPETLRERIGAGTPLGDAPSGQVRLILPTTRTGPLPSPELSHNWVLDSDTPTYLAPWVINGLWLPAGKAFSILVNLPDAAMDNSFVLGQDVRYWRKAANLVLETLALQKLVPVLVQANQQTYHARWQPVLDGPKDAARMSLLTSAMPPVCRALYQPGIHQNGNLTPHALLDNFLKTMCDALARSWSRMSAPRLPASEEDPAHSWLAGLFGDDPVVHVSPAQAQALSSSLKAWLRNLTVAGDAVYRIAFRLDTPPEQPAQPEVKDWQLHFLLQARDDPALLLPAENVWQDNGGTLTYLDRRFAQPQEKLLAGLGYAARLFPPLLPGLQSSQPVGVALDTPSAYAFLREAAPLLEQAGFGLLSPPWWNKPGAGLGVRLHLRPPSGQTAGPLSTGRLGFDSLVEYQWELSLAGMGLTREEFQALAALKLPLVQIRGQWVQLDSEQVEAAIRFWEKQQQFGEISILEAARYGLTGTDGSTELPLTSVVAEGWVAEWLERLSQHEKMVELAQPSGMVGALRPYQRVGYSWLSFFRRYGMGAILADDMGLGKTIQALALIQHEKEFEGRLPGPVLLVCPTSVVTNWEHEVRRFTPGLTTMSHQGPERLRNSEFVQGVKNVDLVLSSYAVVRQDAELVKQVNWYGVILDEAQNIKNSSAKQTQAVRKLNASFRLALTGTPVENRLSELWSIMQFLNPDYLGPQEVFRREFSIPIERFGDPDTTQRLKKLVGPFILRRMKTDPRIIQDLPDKIEMKEFCNLSEEQATLYEAVVQDVMTKVASSGGIERKGLVLSLLMQLKQVCNHPAQYWHQVEAAVLDHRQIAGRSGKLARLVQMLEEVISERNRALVFTQFAEMGKLLNAYLPVALGCSTQFLYGDTPVKLRDQMVRRFQEDEHGPPVFILSLKAGGLGLNLTSASHVFHFDRWWNPAVEDQATDRTYRIGQSHNVEVHKFIVTGTLEEKIDEMIESKKGLAESILGAGEQWITELSTDELRELVKLRR
jgi:SNF2 family DNA or RNA helicase